MHNRSIGKTYLIILLAVIVVIAIGAIAWFATKPPTPTPTQPVHLKIATYSVGSSWYMIGSAMAKVLEKVLPEGSTIDVVPGPGTIGNIPLVSAGDVDLAITMDTYAYFAYKGIAPFEEPITNIRMVVNRLAPYFLLIAVREDFARANNVKTVDDIVEMIKQGKPVVIVTGPKGSIDEYATRITFELYGVTYDDIRVAGGDVIFGKPESFRVEVMKDGRAQVFSDVCTYKHPLWLELTATVDVVYLPLKDEVINALSEEYGFSPYTVEKGTFKGMDSDIPTIGIWAALICRADLPKDVVYTITKALVENKDQLAELFAGLSRFDVEHAHESPIPLHEGAQEYFKGSS